MTDLDKVVETIERNVPQDGLIATIGLVGPAYGNAAGMGNPYAPTGGAVQAVRNAACEAQSLNIANAALARRGTVTMNKPLEAWGAPDSFHRTLALHIDTVTFAACGKGVLDDDNLSPWVWYPVCALLLLVFGLIVWRFA